MIIVMKASPRPDEISRVTKRIEDFGLKAHISEGVDHTVIGVLGKVFTELRDALELATDGYPFYLHYCIPGVKLPTGKFVWLAHQ